MDTTLNLGPLHLPLWLLAAALCVGVSLAAAAVTLGRRRHLRGAAVDLLTGMVLAFLVAWKLTPVLLHPARVLRDPLPLLLAWPGLPGIVAGGLAAAGRAALALRSRRLRLFVARPLGVFFLVLAATTGATALLGRLAAPPPRMAPPIALQDAAGAVVRLDGPQGRVVVLNFWASWCAPCRAEMPELNTFHGEAGERDAALVSVNMTDTESSVGAVTEFAARLGITFPILLDTRGEAARAYGITVVPTTVVIAPDGRVSAIRTGAVDAGWLRRAARAAARS